MSTHSLFGDCMEKLLIVDDNAEIRKQLKWGLGKEYQILQAEDRESGIGQCLKHRPPVVILDLGLAPAEEGIEEGFQALEQMNTLDPAPKVIVVTGRGEREHAVQAIAKGAYDFYSKPIDLGELKIMLGRAFYLAGVEKAIRRLQNMDATRSQFSGLIGQCPRMQDVFTTIRKVASTQVPVLILGESGTGKEMVARAIHERSMRPAGPFIPLNCGAIAESLLESELFGHEKGAFTGAHGRVPGKVEFAEGGTLFLDEIGEMPAVLQVKLLRFLQEKIIQRVGGREDIVVDARIVAATNVDIGRAIAEGRFRDDLYYRLGVVTIALPPLRERGDDLNVLANLFLQRFGTDLGKQVRGFSTAALQAMRAYEWPGNVRELENKVKRAVVMADTAILEAKDLDLEVPEAVDSRGQGASLPRFREVLKGMKLKEARGLVEKEMLITALEEEHGNVSRAADILGLTRPTLYDLLKKHHLAGFSQADPE